MAGNSNSGRKPGSGTKPKPKLKLDPPKKPSGMNKRQAKFWKETIDGCKWLTTADQSGCEMVCQLYDLYQEAYEVSAAHPCDKEARIATTNYADKWRAIMQLLKLDPRGRQQMEERMSKFDTSEETLSPLAEFNIVG